MNLTDAIDQYCERTDPTLLSEPLNLISNFSFILASYLLYTILKNTPKNHLKPGSAVQVAMIGAIGIGSALFHSFATKWAQAADVGPIAAFILIYLFCFLKWELCLSTLGSIVGLGIFAVLTTATSIIADKEFVNGSQQYFGAWTALFGIGCYYMADRRSPARWLTLIAAALLASSLFFRAVDMWWCGVWPLGTHFLWHTINGVVLYLATKSYLIGPLNQRS
jgi:hypothetical protein